MMVGMSIGVGYGLDSFVAEFLGGKELKFR